MDLIIETDNVEVNSGYYGGKDLSVELRDVEAEDILESLFGDMSDSQIAYLILGQIGDGIKEELYDVLKEEFEEE